MYSRAPVVDGRNEREAIGRGSFTEALDSLGGHCIGKQGREYVTQGGEKQVGLQRAERGTARVGLTARVTMATTNVNCIVIRVRVGMRCEISLKGESQCSDRLTEAVES